MQDRGGAATRRKIVSIATWISALFLLIGAEPGRAAAPRPGVSGEQVYAYAVAQTNFGPRRPGTVAYEQARDHIRGLLNGFGLKTWTDAIPTRQYFAKTWRLEALSPQGHLLDGFPMRHSGSTPPAGLTADLVDVGRGTAADFRRRDVTGKIVLVGWGHRFFNLISLGALRDSYQRAVERGAAGYLQFFTNTPGNSYQLMTAAGPDDGRAIPGFSIGKEDARDLQRLLRKGNVRLRLALDGEEREVEAHNLFGILPGRTDEVILIDTHYCSMFDGAVDNASGTAAALALAEYFSRRPQAEREKTLVFCFYGTHEYVDYKLGAQKFLADHSDLAAEVLVAIGLDHMAAWPDKEFFGHDTRIHLMTPVPGLDQLRGVFVSNHPALRRIVFPALLRQRLLPFVVLPTGLLDAIKFGESEGDSLLDWVICESGPAYRLGAPTLRLMMAPQWYHTRLDTVEHFTPEQLKRVVDAHVEIIEAINRTPPEKFRGRMGR